MKEGRASRTAEYMALFRAVETAQPDGRRFFDDPYAAGFLAEPLRTVASIARWPLLGRAVPWVLDLGWPRTRSSGVVRTRFIDDAVRAALGQGARQLVLLGAGFDSRPYRLPEAEGVAVFEVDHPATQAVKRGRLARARPAPARHVTFVPIDFARQHLDDVMAAAGLRPDVPSFVVWEGVTNYLDADAVDGTLRWVARAFARGSELVFTYVHRGILDGSVAFHGAVAGKAAVRRREEPFTFGFDPADVPAYLAGRGLALLEDVAASDYRARYLAPLGRAMAIWEFYRVARAEVVGISETSARATRDRSPACPGSGEA